MGHGNLLGIQPVMSVRDYASEQAFHARLRGYLQQARSNGWISSRTVAVFPEHIGTWLAACGAPEAALLAPTVSKAMRALIFRDPLTFGMAMLAGRERDRAGAALFRMRSISMARIYQGAFSRLAREFGATVAAGSLVLPEPYVADGQIAAGKGPLYNTSAVFAPDGRTHDRLARKIYPVADELAFTCPAPLEALPTFSTPAGRLGVLICADCWYPAPYEVLRAAGAELIAVPSFGMRGNGWDLPWQGYDGAPPPEDVDLTDVGKLTEREAWRKYALAGRIAQSGARYGVNVFLRGDLWDLGGDSGAAIGVCGEQAVEQPGESMALVNVWLG